jgi:DNA repair protein RadC
MECRTRKVAITGPGKVADMLEAVLAGESEIDRDKEHFWTIGMNTRNVIQYVELVSLVTLNASLVHPRETFRLANSKGVSSLLIAHNHPSGNTDPSEDDKGLTRRLVDAGRIIGIEVRDHVIIANNGKYASLKPLGLI